MGFIEVLAIGIGLSMDAFAVSLCKGLQMHKINNKQLLLIALFFGGFQALMPTIGWFLGNTFSNIISSFDHWIAFGLLILIGGNMIREALSVDDETDNKAFSIKELFILAIATSIDALAIGISFAVLDVNIWFSATIIGITTFLISAIGVLIGHKFGIRFKSKAEILGGIILILIGIKILIEHLFF